VFSRMRRRSTVGVVLALAMLVEAAALRSGVLGQVLLGAAAALALVVVVLRADLQRVGAAATLAAAFTISWNGWYVGPVRPGDVLAPLALLCYVIARPDDATRTPPWWVKQLVVVIVLVTLLTVLLPISSSYLSHRLVLDAGGNRITDTTSPIASNIGVALKFVEAVVIPPMAFVAATLRDRRMPHRLAIAFVVGTALSGFVATSDRFLHTSLGRLLTGIPNAVDRQTGFTTQPNFLAAALVVAMPFACWLIVARDRRRVWIGGASLLFLVLGDYASGSRGGAVCAVFALVVSFGLLPRTRAAIPAIVLAFLAGAGLVAAAIPAVGAEILRVTRISGSPTTEGSDIVRTIVGEQGVHDWVHSPVFGIGLHVSTEASQVYLQELASGGLLLLAGMAVYMVAAIAASWRLSRVDDLGAALAASLVSCLVLNFFEADLTDRFYYIPQALAIALGVALAQRGTAHAAGTDDGAAAREPVGAAT